MDREYRSEMVKWFSDQMMRKLDENAYKDEFGWTNSSFKFLFSEFVSELEKFKQAIVRADTEAAVDCCFDMGNYLMMIADNLDQGRWDNGHLNGELGDSL